ncbi:hypothetical protein EDD22DRAFT_946839 [Suillus occidentalis]|nr:hypothetical protein EDD22DRAFT_946839 [Suillus occidentalis]
MPSSRVKYFIKDLDLGKVFAVRLSRFAKNGRTQHSSTTAQHEGDHSVPADIPMYSDLARDPGLQVPINIFTATSSRVDSSARTASDMAQTFLPVVQAVVGAIPFAGPPMQATISGLLSILQAMDRRSQNKADIDRLKSRLNRLSSHLCNAPTAQDRLEQYRRDSIIGILQETSAQLARLQERRLEYASVTQAIAGCSIEIDRYLLESVVVIYSL